MSSVSTTRIPTDGGWPTCLAAALDYRRRGWSVIPLCSGDHSGMPHTHLETCTSVGKRPMLDWTVYQSRLADEETIRHWWLGSHGRPGWRSANVGVVTGEVSCLLGIDVDGEPGEDLLQDICGDNELPPTIKFRTGRYGSYRLLYGLPRGTPCPTVPLYTPDGGQPLKILGNGSQTVMPPSRHASGQLYSWNAGYSPSEFELTVAPAWLLTWLAERGRERRQTENPVGYVDGQPIPSGMRNEHLAKIAGGARRFGCTREEIYVLLERVNYTRCDPPLDNREVWAIARSVCRYDPNDVPRADDLGRMARPEALVATPLSVDMEEVEPKEITWVWPEMIPSGCLVCLDGDGGTGKSTMMLDLCARITRGDSWPDGTRPNAWEGPANIGLVCCEDSVEATILPRLVAANADLTRVKYLEEVRAPDLGQTSGEIRMIGFPQDIPSLEKWIEANEIRLVVIDPILAFIGGDADAHKDQDVRRTIGPMKKLADRLGCTIVYIRHWNKGSHGAKAAYRGGGSLAWINVARAAFCVGHSKEFAGAKEFQWTKGNLTARPRGWVFNTVPVGPGVTRIEWLQQTESTADDLTRDSSDREQQPRNGPQRCADWLQTQLSEGPRAADEMLALGREAGFSQDQLDRARRTAGVRTWRATNENGQVTGWVWGLASDYPDQAGSQQPRNGPQRCADWLQACLSEGPQSRTEVIRQGREAGFSEDQLDRACQRLGIRRVREGNEQGRIVQSIWYLPQDYPPPAAAETPSAQPAPTEPNPEGAM